MTEKINQIEIGNLKIGGDTSMPFFEEKFTKPAIAMEVYDPKPKTLPKELEKISSNPIKWAMYCKEKGADIISLKLKALREKTIQEEAELVKQIAEQTKLPLIITGCGDEEKDAELFTKISDMGGKFIIGNAEQEKYKKIAAIAIAYNHQLVALSNIDINIEKQLNILLTELGMKKENIIIDPLTGALGYGLEYTYSIIERTKLEALQGDKMLQMPILCDLSKIWEIRETKEGIQERNAAWETTAALSCIAAGVSIITMRDPSAMQKVKKIISELQ